MCSHFLKSRDMLGQGHYTLGQGHCADSWALGSLSKIEATFSIAVGCAEDQQCNCTNRAVLSMLRKAVIVVTKWLRFIATVPTSGSSPSGSSGLSCQGSPPAQPESSAKGFNQCAWGFQSHSINMLTFPFHSFLQPSVWWRPLDLAV